MEIPDRLIKKLLEARSVAVLTGAGISAESGVPTFRGEDGLWKKFRPEELANFNAFIRNPDLVWEWYQYRRRLITEVEPNPGHYALAEMERLFPEFLLITQNVDGLHAKAGSRKIVELHGNILRNRCIQCNAIYTDLEWEEGEKVPHCPKCGGLIRPDVVWFGELLPPGAMEKAEEAARNCDVFFSVGTSAVVYPAAALPEVAAQHGAFVVEVNPEPTPVSQIANVVIREKAGVALPEILRRFKEAKSVE
ncbi:MAG TPA: NAD-dependent deacylase [Bacteroidetes bacterium]|nr:NAD-dependent deacylase [Bacteroidota bacterium]